MSDTFVIATPQQLRAISDPLRQRLLGQFAEPATVKAAAARLGVPLSRLYHHIDQLLAAGLIRVVSERRRRAAIERTFQSVGRRFEISPDAAGGPPEAAQVRAAVEQMLTTPNGEVRLARSTLRLTPDRLALLEHKLDELLRVLETPDGVETDILLLAAPTP